jgi:hypothetical protein
MGTATLNRTANALIVSLPRGASQDEIERAIDWVNARTIVGAEGQFIDNGDLKTWIFPAAV